MGQDRMREHLLGSIGWGLPSVGLGSALLPLPSSAPAPTLRSRLLEVVSGAVDITADFVRVRAIAETLVVQASKSRTMEIQVVVYLSLDESAFVC